MITWLIPKMFWTLDLSEYSTSPQIKKQTKKKKIENKDEEGSVITSLTNNMDIHGVIILSFILGEPV